MTGGRAYRAVVRPVLFRLGDGDPEAAHEWTLRRLARLGPRSRAVLRGLLAVRAPREVFGLRFPNPVGLAAGLDKDGAALAAWPALGFGFLEVGTVTWHPQPGNERPRLFRLPDDEALINRMGFNNAGAAALARRLRGHARQSGDALQRGGARQKDHAAQAPVGVSIGKSKVTPLADAVADYLSSFRVLRPYADYVAVNVSSPNTPGLRRLQDRAHLDELLGALRAEDGGIPILLKIAPDLTEPAIADALAACLEHGVAGVIATNTTVGRDGTSGVHRDEPGGLSGRPLAARAREVVGFVHRETGGALPIVGVGGILEPEDAIRLADAGASLVQLYTGLIYRGPGLVRASARAMRRRSAREGERWTASANA